MSCCGTSGCSSQRDYLPSYNAVKALCGLAITGLAAQAMPKYFGVSTAVGFAAHWLKPNLTTPLSNKACASGCTDIVAQSLNIKLDPRISLIVASVFFCCHINHHGREMVPVVGFLAGARIYHSFDAARKAPNLGDHIRDYIEGLK